MKRRTSEAPTTIAEQSLGKALLLAKMGLASYAIWRLVRASIGHGTQDQESAFRAHRWCGERPRVRRAPRHGRADPRRGSGKKIGEITCRVKRVFTALGVVGHLARTVWWLRPRQAAMDYDPRSAIGLDRALSKVSRQSYGLLLLGVVAAGCIGFALYSVAHGRYRKI